jgi:hypothetical protein
MGYLGALLLPDDVTMYPRSLFVKENVSTSTQELATNVFLFPCRGSGSDATRHGRFFHQARNVPGV